MKLKTEVVQTLIPKQTLSIKQQYALQILTMNDAQLTKEISQVMEENPLLEYSDDYIDTLYENDVYEKVSRVLFYEVTLKDTLFEQLHCYPNSIDYLLSEFLIESLDSNGYLRLTTAEIQEYFAMDTDSIEETIAILQTFEPAGVFARDLEECLLIQVCTKKSPYLQTAIRIINDYLAVLANNQMHKIAQAMHVPIEEVMEASKLIKSLSPKPGINYSTTAPLVQPEAVITVENNKINIQMTKNGDELIINPFYAAMEDASVVKYIKQQTKVAKTFLDCLKKRKDTLSSILSYICHIQSDYFIKQGGLKPLTLKEVAHQFDFHESTISRAISSKTIEFNHQILPIKMFFPAKLDSGQSASEIQVMIRKCIDEENPQKPYSDQQLANILEKQSIKISRRTITKYREQMHIVSASQRKKY